MRSTSGGPRVLLRRLRETMAEKVSAQERLDKNLLAGEPLRATDGRDNGVRLLDVNNDGWLDVVIGNGRVRRTRTDSLAVLVFVLSITSILKLVSMLEGE